MKESAVYLTVKMYTKKGKYQKEENSFLLFRHFPINSEIRNVWITNVRQNKMDILGSLLSSAYYKVRSTCAEIKMTVAI